MWLTLDIGNSAVKGGLYDGDTLKRVVHLDLDRAGTATAWEHVARNELDDVSIERIGIASVVPAVTPVAREALARTLGAAVEPIHAEMRLPFALDYTTPETLGVDRLAAAAAAWVHYGPRNDADAARDVVAIDAGTALTLEVVTRKGIYEGGIIAPGPALLRQSLHDGTAQLPAVPLEMPERAIGRSTREAMQIGIMSGFVESVRGLLARICTPLGAAPTVVVTGGWASTLAREINAIDHAAPHLVLDGIRTLMQLNPR